jgi:Fe-S-cluster-containing hydrogenase component 2
MSKALIVNLDKCTGCRYCELACSFAHHGEYNPAKSNIQVSIFTEDAFYVPMVCTQCDRPFCGEVCPTGAISADEVNGAYVVLVDPEKCVGCKMCTMACPFGAITYQSSGIVQKCDLCGGKPQCVEFCVPNALEFKDPELTNVRKSRAYAKKIYHQKEAD